MTGIAIAALLARLGAGWSIGELTTHQAGGAALVLVVLAHADARIVAALAVGLVAARQSAALDVAPLDPSGQQLAIVGACAVGLYVLFDKWPGSVGLIVPAGTLWAAWDTARILGMT